VIPFFHHPIYSYGHHGGSDNSSGGELERLFKFYGVRLVFQGHDHDYYYTQRGGITYVVSGGGGADNTRPIKSPITNPHDQFIDGDKFINNYNFSVCDVYPEWIEVKTYASTTDRPKEFALAHEFVIPLAKKE
jgi:hypothetical protein